MERKLTVLIWILFFIPIVLVYKNLFDPTNPLVWGDAPYFYQENLSELFNWPFIWDIRNSNFGSSQVLTLWLFIPTFLLGVLHTLFNLNHELTIRLVFYFPFLIFSILGNFFVYKKLGLNNISRILGTLFYLVNTYILIVVDGGQIGVALSYGLFPFVFYSLVNYFERTSFKNFLLSLTSHFLIFNTDLRIALILLIFEFLWLIIFNLEQFKKQILNLVLIFFLVILLSGFWIFPFLTKLASKEIGESLNLEQNNFVQLYNSFYLFQPHFPDNDFGNLNKTPIYFIFFPLVFILGFLDKRRVRIVGSLFFLYLIFIFLAKGTSSPFGEVYNYIINNIPLGSAFRDSSKFYIPAIFIAGILIGFSAKALITLNKKILLILIYFLILIGVYPMFIGGLSGVLGNSPDRRDFHKIYNLVNNDNSDFRSLWFHERPSLGFGKYTHPPVSANSLFKERPFASMLNSNYDLFEFLHNKNISDWFELLGIKYIFYPPYEREKSLSKKEASERKQFENFISRVPYLEKINLGTSFPVYQTKNPLPKVFTQEKILLVLGDDDVYQKLFNFENFSLENNSLIFLESCKFDPEIIFNLNKNTFGIITTQEKNDLYMSFFCKDLVQPASSKLKEWSINNSSQYLSWKSQLNERGIRNYDYDFGQGLAYSTNEGEKLQFSVPIVEDGKYYLPIRYLTSTESLGLKLTVANIDLLLKSPDPHKLDWFIFGPLELKKGNNEVVITNLGGLCAVNTLGLIPQDLFDKKVFQLEENIKNFNLFNIDDDKLNEFLNNKVTPLEYKLINPTEYEIKIATISNWIVFSERFDSNWKLYSNDSNKDPLPFYSMINGYYTSDLKPGIFKLYYQPQDSVKTGLIITSCALLLVGFMIIFHIIKNSGYFKKLFRNSKN